MSKITTEDMKVFGILALAGLTLYALYCVGEQFKKSAAILANGFQGGDIDYGVNDVAASGHIYEAGPPGSGPAASYRAWLQQQAEAGNSTEIDPTTYQSTVN